MGNAAFMYHRFSEGVRGILFAVTLTAITVSAHGQPTLDRIDPAGCRMGDRMEIVLRGPNVAEFTDLIFLDPALDLEEFADAPDGGRVARLATSGAVRPGIHWLRAVSPGGVSAMEPFAIGDFPLVPEEDQSNDGPGEAVPIELNRTVEGHIPRGDQDFYRLSLPQGQRLSIELEAIRLTRSGQRNNLVFRPEVAVFQERDGGNELLASSSSSHLFRQDPHLSLNAPETADYLIRVRDFTDQGHDDARYRLHIGDYVRPAVTLPLGLAPDEDQRFRFIEQDGTVHEQRGRVFATADGLGEVFLEVDGRRPQAGNPIRLSPHRNLIVDGSHARRADAKDLGQSLPMAVNGVLASPGGQVWLAIELRKEQKVSLRVVARQLGSPIDTTLLVLKPDGSRLDFNDDASRGQPDSALEIEASEAGRHWIRLKDHLDRGGPTYVYRIEIDEPTPRVALSNPMFQQNDSHYRQFLAVPRGGVGAILMTINRSRVGDPLAFQLPDLPEGMEIISDVVPRGVNQFPLIVRATGNVPLQGLFSRAEMRTTRADAGGFWTSYRQVFNYLTTQPGQTVHHSAAADRLAVVVTEPPPFQVRTTQPEAPLVRGGRLKIPVRIHRRDGYERPMKLFFLWRPNGVATLAEINVPEGGTEAAFELSAGENAAVGDWQVVVLAEGGAARGNVYASSEPVRLKVVNRFLTGQARMTTASLGSSGQLVVETSPERDFGGQITYRVVNGPAGVTFESPSATIGQTEVVIPFQVAEDASLGRHRKLLVRAELSEDDVVMNQDVVENVVLRIDRPRPGDGGAEASGERLSRLEQLRRRAGGDE